MAQKVRSGSVSLPGFTDPPLLERSGPHMPVTWDPESQPAGIGRRVMATYLDEEGTSQWYAALIM